jgi:hypothetical protein
MIEHQHHNLDAEGKPAGGRTKGTGFDFEWNSGPPDKPNGATLEDVLEAAIGRLQFLQKAQPNRDKAIALNHLETAWLWFLKNQTDPKRSP